MAYDECASQGPTRFAELWCANGVGHDASQYIAFGSHDYCMHVISFATSVSCFRFLFYGSPTFSRRSMVVTCQASLLIGTIQGRGCIFAAASVSREIASMDLSECFDADFNMVIADIKALVACAAGLQVDCSQLIGAASCRPMTWDILVTSHTARISSLAEQEQSLDPRPWPLLAV